MFYFHVTMKYNYWFFVNNMISLVNAFAPQAQMTANAWFRSSAAKRSLEVYRRRE